MKSIYILKPYKDRLLKPLAVRLRQLHCSANQITVTGLVAGLFAAVCLWKGLPVYGVALLLVSIAMDLLDGVVARLELVTAFFGKLLDGIADRVVELAWVTALILNGALGVWALALPIGSVSLLLCRIWAYCCRIDSTVVTVTRFERMIALLAVVVLPWPAVAVGIYSVVTVGTIFSSLQIGRMILKNSLRGKVQLSIK